MEFFFEKQLHSKKEQGLKADITALVSGFKNNQIESKYFEMAQRYTDKLQSYTKEVQA